MEVVVGSPNCGFGPKTRNQHAYLEHMLEHRHVRKSQQPKSSNINVLSNSQLNRIVYDDMCIIPYAR